MPTIDVLLVEDNLADAELTREGFAQSELTIRIHHVTDGENALRFLRCEPPFQDAPRPTLVLLDLNLPRRSGLDVLSDIKRAPELRSVPIVVLTSSAAGRDVAQSYTRGANCYIKKPLKFDEFHAVLRVMEEFWFRTVELPS